MQIGKIRSNTNSQLETKKQNQILKNLIDE